MTDQPATQGTATSVPHPDQARFEAYANAIGPDADCELCIDIDDEISRSGPHKARFAIRMLATTSLDGLTLECTAHAAWSVTQIDEFQDGADAFEFVLLPRY